MRRRVSRRTFLAQSSAATTALCLPSFAWAKEDKWVFPDVSELVRHLPPQARYVPRRLPDGENGYLAYRKVLEAVVGTDVLYVRLKERLGDEGPSLMKYGLVASEEETFPHGIEGEVVEIWLQENRRAHELVRAASRFSQGIVPTSLLEQEFFGLYSSDEDNFRFLPLNSLLIAEELHYLYTLKEEDTAEAVASILVASRLHRMLKTAPASLFATVMVISVGRFASRWMRRAARYPWTTPEQVDTLRNELALWGESRDWIIPFLQVELHYFLLPLIKFLQDAQNLEQVADILIRFRGDFPFLAKGLAGEQALRTLTTELLEGHPQPFDAIATAKSLGLSLARYIEHLADPTLPAQSEIPAEVKECNALWPQEWIDQLGAWTFYYKLEVQEEEDDIPLTPEQKREIRDALHKRTNPLGKLLFLAVDSDMLTSLYKTFEVDHRLTQIVLAGRLYWNRHDQVPRSLEVLVDEGLLESVPLDPFGEGPLKYDPQRALVWSVGHNGADDRGESFDVFEDDLDDPRDDVATRMPKF